MLKKLNKKAILIPTPGQTEQEYLSKYLMNKNMFYTIEQKNFSLQNDLLKFSATNFYIPDYDMSQYKKVIQQFIASIKK